MKKIKKRRRERGQSLVEFALVLPILLMLLCGIIDFGWVYYNQIALSNAAREGARYAVIHYDDKGIDWKEQAKSRMLSNLVGIESATAFVTDNVDQQITAEVTADARLLTGFTSTILGKRSIELHAECTMRREN